MKTNMQNKGQEELRKRILDTGLCTNCGACINICPYLVTHKDKVVVLDSCDRDEGRCYAFCPRAPTNLETLQRILFNSEDLTPELGALKGFYLTRSADPRIRRQAQHGGTATTLVSLALNEKLIDAAVVAAEGRDFLPEGVIVKSAHDLLTHSRSKFVVAANLSAFHQAAKEEIQKIGVVATPCQALALAKMRTKPYKQKDSKIDKLHLVIGLFCGWAFSWLKLKTLLKGKIGEQSVIHIDIPPSKYNSLEVHTPNKMIEIDLEEVMSCVRESCRYCSDMTAEFSDISVGSARLPDGWEEAQGWNHVIVRTKTGQELFELAKSRGLLELRQIPEHNLDRLKKASLNKKGAKSHFL